MTVQSSTLKARIQERFPEGLTGIFIPGGTRTGYILEHNRHKDAPGEIDWLDYTETSLDKSRHYIRLFFEMGVQNLIVGTFSIQGFYERGGEYAAALIESIYQLIGDEMSEFYRQHNIAPHFTGVDVLLHLPPDNPAYQLGEALQSFLRTWRYQDGQRKLIWEVMAIPLFSFWKAHEVMGRMAQHHLERDLAQESNLLEAYRILYSYYSRAAYGTDIPMPHFYLASSRNGDIKPRALIPFGLLCGGPMRIYTVPYPSYFMTDETLIHILEDLVSEKRFSSTNADYRGKLPSELAEAMYLHYKKLAENPASTVGLSQNVLASILGDKTEDTK